jgi:hypothetical protein
MSVCVYSVFVLFYMMVAALQRADPPSKESYRLSIGLRDSKSGQGPTEGCRAIDRFISHMKLHCLCVSVRSLLWPKVTFHVIN